MARRLPPAQRRAEIVVSTREMIATGVSRELSLRAIARYCGLSAPGLAHHFPTVKELIETVLVEREEEAMAAVAADLSANFPDPSLLDLADAVVRHYAGSPEESAQFCWLEAEAMAPDHPAHDYFSRAGVRPREITVQLARQEYAEPEVAIRLLSVAAEGIRVQWMRATQIPDFWGDWAAIRGYLLAGLAPRDPRAQ